jgi:hypothetical protein
MKTQAARILVVEDNADTAALLRDLHARPALRGPGAHAPRPRPPRLTRPRSFVVGRPEECPAVD